MHMLAYVTYVAIFIGTLATPTPGAACMCAPCAVAGRSACVAMVPTALVSPVQFLMGVCFTCKAVARSQHRDHHQAPMQGAPIKGTPMQGAPMQGAPIQGVPMQGALVSHAGGGSHQTAQEGCRPVAPECNAPWAGSDSARVDLWDLVYGCSNVSNDDLIQVHRVAVTISLLSLICTERPQRLGRAWGALLTLLFQASPVKGGHMPQ